MALITRIRNHSWLLIVLIGLGMAGFLLMDMLNSRTGLFNNSSTVGTIAGKKVDIQEFNRKADELFGSSGERYGNYERTWDYFIQETLLEQEAKKLGFGVSKEELNALMTDPSKLSPIVVNEFRGGNGQFDFNNYKNILNQVISTGTPEQKRYWKGLENRVSLEALSTKLSGLVNKAIYTPTWMVETMNQDNSASVDIEYVAVPLAAIANSEVQVSDADLKAYMSENPKLYYSENPTRSIEYVTFSIKATQEDSTDVKAKLNRIVENWTKEEKDSIFVLNNYGVYDIAYTLKAELNNAIAEKVFTADKGTVFGPYVEGNTFRVARLLDKKILADSVKARHIFLPVQTQEQFNQNKALADSLILLLESGVSFDTLNKKHNQDFATLSNGGDLGVFTLESRSVEPQIARAAFYTAKKNKPTIVFSARGIHVMELTNVYAGKNEAARLAYISEKIVPSQATEDAVYNKAYEMLTASSSWSDFKSKLTATGLTVDKSGALEANDYAIQGLDAGESSRKVVKWAFDAKKDELSPEIFPYDDKINNYTNRFVVAGLTAISPAGMKDLESVRDEVSITVMNQKKAEILRSKINSKDLAAIAAQYNSEVKTAQAVSFGNSFVPGIGQEPKIVAQLVALPENTVSAPLAGNNAVVVAKVTKKNPAQPVSDIATQRQMISRNMQSNVGRTLFDSLKKMANVKDARNNFF